MKRNSHANNIFKKASAINAFDEYQCHVIVAKHALTELKLYLIIEWLNNKITTDKFDFCLSSLRKQTKIKTYSHENN